MAHTPLTERIKALREEGTTHKKTRSGHIIGMQEHYDDPDMVRLELREHGPKPKQPKNTKSPVVDSDYKRRFDAVIPKAHAAKLKMGQRVHVHTIVQPAKGGTTPDGGIPSASPVGGAGNY